MVDIYSRAHENTYVSPLAFPTTHAGSERHKYGQQRLWGTVGMGITAIVSGALVDLYSRGLPQQDFLPMIIIALVVMSLDMAVVARMDIPQNKREKLKMGDVGSALLHPQVLLFLVG